MPLKMSFLAEELAWRNVRFSDNDWWKLMDAGVSPRWKTKPQTWLFLRILLAVGLDGIIVYGLIFAAQQPQSDCSAPLQDVSSLSKEDRANTPHSKLYAERPGTSLAPFWFFYLTNWGLILQAIYLHTAALATWFYFVPCYKSGQDLATSVRQPAIVTMAWLFRTLALTLSICIFLFYWALLFPGSVKRELESPMTFIDTLLAHGVNTLIQAADLLLSYEPFLFAGSFFVVQLCNVTYFSWSLIHYATGITNGRCDRYLYAFLDWGSPATAIIFFFGFVILGVPFLCGLSTAATKCVRPKAQRDMLFAQVGT